MSSAESSTARSGDACPLHYHYAPSVFRAEPSFEADTVYVIGGLYGNVEALRTILRMRDDEHRQGKRVALVFNGDYNWFDVDAESFREINEAALAGISIVGNVEAEIAAPSGYGCGCDYPDYVDRGIAARSDAIMRRLQDTASGFTLIRKALAALPMIRTLGIGEERIGIVHGDAESLAGLGVRR